MTLYDSFHWKCSNPRIHQIEKLGFLGISRYTFRLSFWFNINLYHEFDFLDTYIHYNITSESCQSHDACICIYIIIYVYTYIFITKSCESHVFTQCVVTLYTYILCICIYIHIYIYLYSFQNHVRVMSESRRMYMYIYNNMYIYIFSLQSHVRVMFLFNVSWLCIYIYM